MAHNTATAKRARARYIPGAKHRTLQTAAPLRGACSHGRCCASLLPSGSLTCLTGCLLVGRASVSAFLPYHLLPVLAVSHTQASRAASNLLGKPIIYGTLCCCHSHWASLSCALRGGLRHAGGCLCAPGSATLYTFLPHAAPLLTLFTFGSGWRFTLHTGSHRCMPARKQRHACHSSSRDAALLQAWPATSLVPHYVCTMPAYMAVNAVHQTYFLTHTMEK